MSKVLKFIELGEKFLPDIRVDNVFFDYSNGGVLSVGDCFDEIKQTVERNGILLDQIDELLDQKDKLIDEKIQNNATKRAVNDVVQEALLKMVCGESEKYLLKISELLNSEDILE